MADFEDVIIAIQDRTGYKGDEYIPRIKSAINWAKDEINQVDFRFLLVRNSASLVTVIGQNRYDLPASPPFARLNAIYVVDGADRRELQEGNEEQIIDAPSTTSATPNLYTMYGYNATTGQQQIAIGAPTPAAAFPTILSYYRKMVDLSASADKCPIQQFYRDEPLISGGLYKFHKDLDEHDISLDAWKDFLIAMKDMETVLPYNGKSYGEKFGGQ